MNKLNYFIYIICLFFILSCNESEKYWKNISVSLSDNGNPFIVNSLQRTTNGDIYVFGHFKDETINCGFLGIMNCEPLLIFKSNNDGENWTQIATAEMSKKHSNYESDKIPVDLLPIDKSLKNAKKFISTIASAVDSWSYRVFQNNEDDAYFYVDGDLYKYNLGHEWSALKTNSKFNNTANQDDPIFMSKDEIYYRVRVNCNNYYLKKDKDIYKSKEAYYSILVDENLYVKLIPELRLNNKSSDEYDSNNNLIKRRNNFIIDEIYKSNNGNYFSTIELDEKTGGSTTGFFVNDKLGNNFRRINLFKSEELNKRCSDLRIKGVKDNFVLLKVNLAIPNTNTSISSNVAVRFYFIFDAENEILYHVKDPSKKELFINRYLVMNLNQEDGTLFFADTDGIYQTRKEVSLLLNKVLFVVDESIYL